MEEQVIEQPGVEAPVAGEQVEQQEGQQAQAGTTESGAEGAEVAAQGGEQQNYGPIITAEVQRREAQMQKKYETQVKALERSAKIYGFSDVETFIQALDKYEREQEIRAEAEKLGVDESVVIEHLAPLKEKLSEYEREMQTVREREAQLRIEQEVNRLKSTYPDFEQYQLETLKLVIDNGYKMEDAYKLASYQDKLANISKQTEAETIRKLQGNAASTPGALGSEGAEHKTGFAALSKEEQRRMIEEVKAGRRTSL